MTEPTSHMIERTFATLPVVNQGVIRWLRKERVPASAIGDLPWLAESRVEFLPGRRFEFAGAATEKPEKAIVFLVNDAFGAIDLAAWQPRSGRLATWLGRAFALGQDNVWAPRLDAFRSLAVCRTPLSWLAGGREGIVILDETKAAEELALAGPLRAEDGPHVKELTDKLTRHPPPIIACTFVRAAA
ncbi:hypothetical protein NK718_12815 [Alsobacter sp. SYSU M60028]|uniref:Uncharacterized protein n=1 Tax=Alsobacter ponti TaxID=2962936 RepID=A0ABT1LD87_9HYPH|nr:hypothetical protein [Alsobacter ponti]MCP8939399.1 hypothetical protein [Alsobacter ponti]